MPLKISMPDPSLSASSQDPGKQASHTVSCRISGISAHGKASGTGAYDTVDDERAPKCLSPDLNLTSPESFDESSPHQPPNSRELKRFSGPPNARAAFNSPPISPPAKPFVTHSIERSVSPSSVDAAAALLTLSIKHGPTNSVRNDLGADEILDRIQKNLENAHVAVRGDDHRKRKFLQILQSAIGVLASESASVSPKTPKAHPEGPLRPLSANIPARNNQNSLDHFKWQRQDFTATKTPLQKPILGLPPHGTNYMPSSSSAGPAPPVTPSTPYNHGAAPLTPIHSMIQPQVYPPPMYYGYNAPPQQGPGQHPLPAMQLSPDAAPKTDRSDDPKYTSGNSILSSSSAYKRRRKQRKTTKCHECGTTETPEWRRGPDGARTLCNACGLYHAKLAKKWGSAEATELLKERASQRKRPVW